MLKSLRYIQFIYRSQVIGMMLQCAIENSLLASVLNWFLTYVLNRFLTSVLNRFLTSVLNSFWLLCLSVCFEGLHRKQ